ncbi:MAG TPA: protein kinase [Gemmataceae bacterium]|nr:protein kinase [Gemmataceae bacterium]
MIVFPCARCGQKLQIPDSFAGKPVRCSVCKQVMTSPKPVAVAVAAAVPLPEIAGQPSSLAQAGFKGDVTLGQSDSSGTADNEKASSSQRSLRQALAHGHAGGERYRVLGHIARGGMGAVLRAADCDIRREVAVKYLLDQADERKKARFIEESQITGQLEHPNIVPIHELGVDAKKRLFFSMKMVRGRSLQQVFAELRDYPRTTEKEYTLTRLLNTFVSVCHALAYAHARGVVHRDLKPANIMLGDFGEVYVMDWGLAKVLPRAMPPDKTAVIQAATPSFAWAETGNASASAAVQTNRQTDDDQTVEGTILGTPLYMSPEQAIGAVAAIDERSDIYSLGALLYEMLTLQPPIEKDGGPMAILMRVSQGEIIPPAQRTPERARAGKIPKELAAVAMKALAKNPHERYQAVEELRRDIERFLEGRSVSAKEDTQWETMWKFAQRNKGFSAATAAATVLLAVVLLWSTWVNYKARLRAEAAYAAYLKEQDDKRAQVRKSVPAFVEAAHLAAERKKFEDALAQVNAALDYDPEHAPARLLKGQLLIARKDYTAARRELERYLKSQPNDAQTAKLARLCAAAKRDDPAVTAELADILIKQHLATLAEGLLQAPEKMLAIHRQKIEKAWPGLGERLTMDADGRLSLNLSDAPQVLDLAPVNDMPLRALLIHRSQIRDLTPLQGMPLTSLNLNGCPRITDLTPLKGLKLTYLAVQSCGEIDDFSALKGMPLTHLYLHGRLRDEDLRLLGDMPLSELSLSHPEITNLDSLRGRKLTSLSINPCAQLKELTPLQGMPLTSLSLITCGSISDLTPLQGMPLISLTLQQASQVHDLTPLAGMRLSYLSLYGCDKVTDLSSLKDMPLTYLNLHGCTEIKDLTVLRGMPLTGLDVGGCGRIDNLTPLQGIRLTQLAADGCAKIMDWTPLRGMPLNSLVLQGCEQIKDLTALQGLPLTSLSLQGCRGIKSLEPLRDMPLTHLRIWQCDQVTDLTPLEGMKLTYVYFSPRAATTGVDILRRMKSLTTINDLPAETFWKKYDAGEWNK